VGRAAGSLARQAAPSSRSPAGSAHIAGSACTTRYSTEGTGPSPNGPAPVPANTSTLPSENTSPAGPTSPPTACSGDMNAGVPTTSPAAVITVASREREMPKSMTRGPSMASSTLAGLRSRCTSPRLCTSARASARPAARSHDAASGNGPPAATTSASDGPATSAVASHGGSSSGPAAVTGAVNAPLTARAAATSLVNRARNAGSAARCAWITFTATGRPAGENPR
jgi:hypothetical protein